MAHNQVNPIKLTYLCTGEEFEHHPPRCPFGHAAGQESNNNSNSNSNNNPVDCRLRSPYGCTGALMDMVDHLQNGTETADEKKKRFKLLKEAEDYIRLFYKEKNLPEASFQSRWAAVQKEIDEKGTYELTYDELAYGCKVAWRNSSRCINRIQWQNMEIIDKRNIKTVEEFLEAMWEHVRLTYNGGNVITTLTVFPRDYITIWNSQVFRYAAYEKPNGQIVGDPINLEFTKLCQRLGWKGAGTPFDVLPFVFLVKGEEMPRVVTVPEELQYQVSISHPKYPCFAQMGLRWFALPIITNIGASVGGIDFDCTPFNGWFMGSEIGRDLADPQRYNLVATLGKKMGLDTTSNTSLWKDQVYLEINYAILYSFQKQRVSIVDHHSATEGFMSFFKKEISTRKHCPADWVWLVPPISGGITPVFHLETINYSLKPSYEYLGKGWKNFKWPKKDGQDLSLKSVFSLGMRLTAVKMDAMKRRLPVTILYGTETGKSEIFARKLHKSLLGYFNPKIILMEHYDINKLSSEACVIFVTSTFGMGQAPANARNFENYFLDQKKHPPTTQLKDTLFSVFGLGNRAYENFCGFATTVDSAMKHLGAIEISPIGKGDELSGQERAFSSWKDELIHHLKEAAGIHSSGKIKHNRGTNFLYEFNNDAQEGYELKKSHNKDKPISRSNPYFAKVTDSTNLCPGDEEKNTIRLVFDISQAEGQEMKYNPGDHLGVYPSNPDNMVDKLLQLLGISAEKADKPFQVVPRHSQQADDENTSPLPTYCTIRDAFTHYLDISCPPSQHALKAFSEFATSINEQKELVNLATDENQYMKWKRDYYHNVVQVLEKYPSVKLPWDLFLELLSTVQPRYYSISSSRALHPGQVHISVGILRFANKEGQARLGLCSNFLAAAQAGVSHVPIFVKSNPAFHLPEKSAPVIMAAAGTGMAPFRSFWEEFTCLKNQQYPSYLFFGCRTEKDYLYKDEITKLLEKKQLTQAVTAYSRIPTVPKQYVQDKLFEHKQLIWDLIDKQKGYFYVCGDLIMSQGVESKLRDIFEQVGGLSKFQAREYLKNLKATGRFLEDVFGIVLNVASELDRMSEQWKIAYTPEELALARKALFAKIQKRQGSTEHLNVTVATPTGQSLGQGNLNELKTMFMMIDSDNTGSIDATELSQLLTKLGMPLTVEETAVLIKKFDKSANAQLEFEEFVAFMTTHVKFESSFFSAKDLIEETFKMFDADNSGFISASELLQVMKSIGQEITLNEAEEMIRQVDSNGDGKISLDELKAVTKL